MTAESGLVVVDKPAGMTSHDVVARVRRLAGTRKVGHAGTLDPMATGVLVLGVNRATRLLGHLMLTEKGYDATIRLGVATTTDDAEGEVTATVVDRRPRRGRRSARPPPSSSATCSRCRPRSPRSRSTASAPTSGCATARRSSSRPGRSPSTSSTVHDVRAATSTLDVDVSVRCSSGTYIRAIARDLGARLGVGGHLTALRRTAVGPYDLDERPHPRRAGRGVRADADRRRRPRGVPGGRPRRRARPPTSASDGALDLDLDGLTAVFAPDGEFLALYEPRGETAKAVAVFVVSPRR